MGMNFISSEEFERQPKEVQNVFLEWWKPLVGDLVYDRGSIVGVLVPVICIGQYKTNIDKNKHIPLLTETQLRRFIEDKICNGKISTEYYESGYKIFVLDPNFDDKSFNDFETDKTDLIEAYWDVACQIAKDYLN
jgi:hypothetical protein